MPAYTTDDIRNVALVGHAGAGKTSLAEALLFRAGAIAAQGSVAQGDTVCDFDPQEKEVAHSLDSAIASFDHGGSHVNLIDTPGHPDFMCRALGALAAVETAAIVIDAPTGVEMVTRRVMGAARQRNLCRLIIVNKIDVPSVDAAGVLAQIQELFGTECLPINLPAEGGKHVVDCFSHPSAEGPTDFSSVSEARTRLVDQVVEVDEELMGLYLEQGQELEPQQLHDPFEQTLREGHLVPVCFVSAETGAGIPELLEILEHLMPTPSEGNPPPFLKGFGEQAQEVLSEPDPDKHVVAHVFKIVNDPFAGKQGIFRIYQGTVRNNTQLYVGDGRKPFKVGRLIKLQGQEQRTADVGIPGDICAVAKVEGVQLDAVLHDSHDEDFFHLRPLDLPAPMFGLAIDPGTRGEEQRISDVLHKLDAEDPCLVVEHTTLNETVLRGSGELHLRAVLERMKRMYHVEVATRPPRVAYRETITARADGHCRHKKQTGGAGQFGEVLLRVEPLDRGAGFEFVDQVVGGAIPGQFIPAVEKGVRQVLDYGAIAGYPLQDVRVTVYDGKHHPVDSKEVAFVTAGKKAFLNAISKASPIVLEPYVSVQITAPDANTGDVSRDLSGKRGRITGTDILPGGQVCISGEVPLSELGSFQSELTAMTAGEGYYTMDFSHYEPVPSDVQRRLAAAFQSAAED
jgi:elongation factor G